MKLHHFLLLIIFLSGNAHAASLPSPVLKALKQAHIPLSSVGIEVRELNARKPLICVNANQTMNPASTMKLLTTYAGLEILGSTHSWKTEAYLDGKLEQGVLQGDLVLKGYGDPKLSLEKFWLWLRELRDRGLRDIRGNLVLDRSAFETQTHDSSAFDNEPTRPYNMGPDALLLNFNAVRLRFIPDGEKINVISEPELAGITRDNRIAAATGTENCSNWDEHISTQLNGGVMLLQGTFPIKCGECEDYICPLPHPQYMAAVFRTLWQEMGGTLDGELREGMLPENATLFATHHSAPLSELIRDINKFSNNVMARQLFMSLSASPKQSVLPENNTQPKNNTQTGNDTQAAGDAPCAEPLPCPLTAEPTPVSTPPPASIARSEQVMRDWLTKKGLNFPELVLENGAGLSRRERISPHHLALLLQSAKLGPLSAEFEASLPIVGVDGTFKKRLTDKSSTGYGHLKTGSLEGVNTVAGYVQSGSGKQWIVVFLINHPNAYGGQQAQDALIEWVQGRR